MNDVTFHVPYIFGNKQNSKTETEKRENRYRRKTEEQGTKRGQW